MQVRQTSGLKRAFGDGKQEGAGKRSRSLPGKHAPLVEVVDRSGKKHGKALFADQDKGLVMSAAGSGRDLASCGFASCIALVFRSASHVGLVHTSYVDQLRDDAAEEWEASFAAFSEGPYTRTVLQSGAGRRACIAIDNKQFRLSTFLERHCQDSAEEASAAASVAAEVAHAEAPKPRLAAIEGILRVQEDQTRHWARQKGYAYMAMTAEGLVVSASNGEITFVDFDID